MKHIGIKRLQASDIEVICMYCKKIKNSDGVWDQSIQRKKALSHGVCPECLNSVWKPEVAAAMGIGSMVIGSIAKVGAAAIS